MARKSNDSAFARAQEAQFENSKRESTSGGFVAFGDVARALVERLKRERDEAGDG